MRVCYCVIISTEKDDISVFFRSFWILTISDANEYVMDICHKKNTGKIQSYEVEICQMLVVCFIIFIIISKSR